LLASLKQDITLGSNFMRKRASPWRWPGQGRAKQAKGPTPGGGQQLPLCIQAILPSKNGWATSESSRPRGHFQGGQGRARFRQRVDSAKKRHEQTRKPHQSTAPVSPMGNTPIGGMMYPPLPSHLGNAAATNRRVEVEAPFLGRENDGEKK